MTSAMRRVGIGIVLLTFSAGALAADELLINGDFSQWEKGAPQGWRVEIGAQNDTGPESSVEKIDKAGLSLRGDAATRIWKAVSQSFPAEPNATYRLKFEARARDIQRMGRQFDNCYVGMVAKVGGGKVIGREFLTVTAADWTSDSLVFTPPSQANTADVLIFLSKTGTLEVRSTALEKLAAHDSFRVLVDEMDRHYSFFAPKQIDWRKLAGQYTAQGEKAENAEAFVAAVQPMLRELRDPHITIQMPDKRQLPTFVRDVKPNYDFKHVAGKLQKVEQIGKIGLVGRGAGDVGYVAIGSLGGDEATFRKLEKAIEGLLDAPGLIVDLRANQGGDETRARRIAGLFTSKPVVYAKSQIRAGVKHSDLTVPYNRTLEPRGARPPYVPPIVCLFGPRCISSGEGMAQMFKALPQVTTMGQPTAGASGNPAPLLLPNGVTVSYSRWLSLTPDGELTEGKGIAPKIVVESAPPGDSTFDEAMELIAKRVAGK